MTRDEIIRISRELDMIDFRDNDSDPHVAQFIDFLESVIGKAVAAEREACAKACEETGAYREAIEMAQECAAAIRSRGAIGGDAS